MRKHLNTLKELICNPNPESLAKTRGDVHAEGLYSIPFAGQENGKLSRAFIAFDPVKPFDIQLHTHCYPIRITVLQGYVKHHVATPVDEFVPGCITIDKWQYRSPVRHGDSKFTYAGEHHLQLQEYSLPIGSSITLAPTDIHTVSCSKGSIWVVEEQGYVTEESMLFGIPFTADTMYRHVGDSVVTMLHNRLVKAITPLVSCGEVANVG